MRSGLRFTALTMATLSASAIGIGPAGVVSPCTQARAELAVAEKAVIDTSHEIIAAPKRKLATALYEHRVARSTELRAHQAVIKTCP